MSGLICRPTNYMVRRNRNYNQHLGDEIGYRWTNSSLSLCILELNSQFHLSEVQRADVDLNRMRFSVTRWKAACVREAQERYRKYSLDLLC